MKMMKKDLSDPAFLHFAEACPHMITIINRGGHILFANNTCQRMLGYRREDLYKPDFNYLTVIAPEYRAAARKNFLQFLKGRPVPYQETCALTQDGMMVHMAVTVQPVVFRGQPALMGVMSDITERKHLERKLVAERDRLQFYIDGMATIVVALNASGNVLQINKKGCRVLGYPAEKILGKNWFDHFIPKSIRRRVKATFAELMAGTARLDHYFRNPVLTRSGVEVLVEWHNNVLTDEEGTIVGTLSSGIDISTQAQTRAIIRQSEEKYKELFKSAPIGIYRTAPDGRILMANPAIVKMLRYSSFEDLARVNVIKGTYPPDFPRSRFTKALMAKRSLSGFEAKWMRKDGTALHVRENSRVVYDSKGKILYYEGTIEDITEQKTAKEALDHQIAFEKLVTAVAMRFMNLPPLEMNKGIDQALRDLGQFMGVDRGYVFNFYDNNAKMDNTYEWVQKGVDSHIHRLKGLSTRAFGWSNSQLIRKEVVVVPQVRSLPPEAAVEKREFSRESIQSLILVPLVCGTRVMGFLGFDSVLKPHHWTDNSISLLKIIGEIFASAMERKKEEEELLHRIELENIITSTSTKLVHIDAGEIDKAIRTVLRDIGEFCDADRSYLYHFDPDGRSVSLSYGWSRPGLSPMSSKRTTIEFAALPVGLKMLSEGKTVYVSRAATVPLPAEAELTYMRKHGIKSLLCVPFACGNRRGFLGFSSETKEQTWTPDVVTLLKITSESLASAMERQQADASLRLRVAFGETIASLSAGLIGLAPDEMDDALHGALNDIRKLLKADDCSLCQLTEEGDAMRLVYQWCHSGPSAVPADCVVHSSKRPPWSLAKLKNMEFVHISDVGQLPPHSEFEVAIVSSNKLRSITLIPFHFDRTSVGVLGFAFKEETPLWAQDIVALFKIIGDILTSVMELKSTSSSLHREQQQLKALLDNIPDHIYFKDEKSRFINANKAMYAGHGIAKLEDIIGKTDFDLFTKDHAQPAFDDEQAIIQTGTPIIAKEEKENWPDGKVTWASTTKLPLHDGKGKIIGTFGVSRDITEKKQAEEERRKLEAQMQHAQKLESLGVLSGGIAHDFNNLLMGILGNTGLALMQLTPESPVWSHIKQIETVALRAAELTNQMLAYSGKSKFVVEPFNLTTLVSEMAHLLEVSICKRIALEYQFDETIPLMEGDASQVRQIIMNLITNASDAIGNRKGKIVVTTGVMDCPVSYLAGCYIAENLSAGRYIFVEVSDTGCGMDARTLEQIFDPFFTTKVKGRGLGLAAVLGIVRSHRGTLKVYSEIGKGTNFKVLFPCSAAKSVKTVAQKEKSGWRGSGTILIVDDDEVIRVVTEQMLKILGFSVLTAQDGRTAIKQCRECDVDLAAILLDVTLPETSTGELIEEMRQLIGKAPIILFSGYNEATATTDMKPGSFDGFLQKPFTADALAKVLQEALGNS